MTAASSDEESAIRAIGEALAQVTTELNGDPLMNNQSSATATISLTDAEQFVTLFDSLIVNAATEERARTLVFDVNPHVLPTIFSILHCPRIPTPNDPLCQLIIAVLRLIVHLTSGSSSTATSHSVYLRSLVCDTIVKQNAVPCVTSALVSGAAPSIQHAAGEALFSLLMQSASSRKQFIEAEGVQNLLHALGHDRDAASRAYVAACLRELANAETVALLQADAIPLLARALSLDQSADVRALCAETIDVVLKCEPQFWGQYSARKELSSIVVGRLERERSTEVMEATLKLIETLLVSDSNLPPSGDSTFTDYFLGSFGDRFLVASMEISVSVASLAARALRLLIQLAPHYRYVGYNLCQHFPSFAKILQVIVQAQAVQNSSAPRQDQLTSQILRVELGIAFSLMLSLDPRCRDVVAQQLIDQPDRATEVRNALLQSLNAAAMEYFGGIAMIDATGEHINDPSTVQWEAHMRPTRASVMQVISEQTLRWQESQQDEGRHNKTNSQRRVRVPILAEEEEGKATRLTFILLSYTAFMALSGNSSATAREASVRSADGSFSPRRNDGAAASASPGRGVPPAPTRTSMLREFRSNPQKQAAVERVASMRDAGLDISSHVHYTPHHYDVVRDALHLKNEAKRHQVEKADKSKIFSKFDGALALAKNFARFYNQVGDAQKVIYETDGQFARRKPTRSSWYAAPTVKAKSWTLNELKEGDLFYFSIPCVTVSAYALQQVRARATRHLHYIKNSFTITPQAAKARRWFLFDMLHHIMPGITSLLSEFIELCELYGDENVKFPLLMLQSNNNANSPSNNRSADNEAPNSSTLNSGNVIEALQQVQFYFQNLEAQKRANGESVTTQAQQMTSQHLADLENKIRSLASMDFTGREGAFLPPGEIDGDISDRDVDEISNAEPTGANSPSRRGITAAMDDAFDSDGDFM